MQVVVRCLISLYLAWGRGGLILYRTKVPAGALNGRSVLDIGEPVRDYAKARRGLLKTCGPAGYVCVLLVLLVAMHAASVSNLANKEIVGGSVSIDLTFI